MLVGNSSSGIMETASLALPTVNIGNRQRGRTRPQNVVGADAGTDSIRAAIERAAQPEFREGLRGMSNPYGDSTAGRRIADLLAGAPGRERLLNKRALPVRDGRFVHE